VELAVQKVFCCILWILRLPGTAVAGILDGRFDILGPADSQHSLVIDMYVLIMVQLVVDPAVAHIRVLCVDLLDFLCQRLILCCPAAEFAGGPLVVSGTGDMEQLAAQLYGTAIFLVAFFDRAVKMLLPFF